MILKWFFANSVLACLFRFVVMLLFEYLRFCTLCLLTTLVYVVRLHDPEQDRLLLSTQSFALTEFMFFMLIMQLWVFV